MIKLTANMSKKVPMEGVDFASKGFSAGVEVEVTDLGDVQGKLRDLYGLLESAIDDEIAGHAPHREQQQQQVPSASAIIPGSGNGNARGWGNNGNGNNGNTQNTTRQQSQQPQQRYRSGGNGGNSNNNGSGNSGSGNGNNAHRLATAAQVKAIGAIAAASGIGDRDLSDMIRQRFEATHAEALTVRDASTLIDHLKQLQAA